MESSDALIQAITERYRCPETFLDVALSGKLSSEAGYFRLGRNLTCYGHCSCAVRNDRVEANLIDALPEVTADNGQVKLPFNPTEVVRNFQMEKYSNSARERVGELSNWRKSLYYLLRPYMTLPMRRTIQKFYTRKWRSQAFPRWPVDTTVEDLCEKVLLLAMAAKGLDRVPFVWFWPYGAPACMLMTHDVETEAGRNFCADLMDLDDAFGIKASFHFIPEGGYTLLPEFLDTVRARGFEVAIQDLNHDGRLFDRRDEFLRRAAKINSYGAQFSARGFRAGVLYRKPEWLDALNFSFDTSIPNVAHLDPQRGGCCTVMPYFIGNLVELPVTTTQDYMVFHILDDRTIDLWKRQIDLILEKHGLSTFVVHPDYVIDPQTRSVYKRLIGHLREVRERRHVWFALPTDIDSWWRTRSRLSVQRNGDSWRIIGEGAERAVLAFATNVGGHLAYEVLGAKEAA
ncbi:MAG TPA: hypothetical protein VGV15_23255 [Terriglobales bacterium]|nr:hypothetical protein [Terriglobales bacterium]